MRLVELEGGRTKVRKQMIGYRSTSSLLRLGTSIHAITSKAQRKHKLSYE